MYICICIHIYIYICVYTYTYIIYTYIYVYMYTYVYTYISLSLYIYIYMYLHTYSWMSPPRRQPDAAGLRRFEVHCSQTSMLVSMLRILCWYIYANNELCYLSIQVTNNTMLYINQVCILLNKKQQCAGQRISEA